MSLPSDLIGLNEELIFLQLAYGKDHPNRVARRFNETERETTWNSLIDGKYVFEQYNPPEKRTEGGEIVGRGTTTTRYSQKGMKLLGELKKKWGNC